MNPERFTPEFLEVLATGISQYVKIFKKASPDCQNLMLYYPELILGFCGLSPEVTLDLQIKSDGTSTFTGNIVPIEPRKPKKSDKMEMENLRRYDIPGMNTYFEVLKELRELAKRGNTEVEAVESGLVPGLYNIILLNKAALKHTVDTNKTFFPEFDGASGEEIKYRMLQNPREYLDFFPHKNEKGIFEFIFWGTGLGMG